MGLYRKSRGAMAQRSRIPVQGLCGVQKNHTFVWIQARHGGLPLAGFSLVFAEDQIVYVKTDKLVLHHMILCLLSFEVYT